MIVKYGGVRKKIVVFEDSMCTRKCGMQLMEKSWCVQENPYDSHDRYVVAVKREGLIIRHLP